MDINFQLFASAGKSTVVSVAPDSTGTPGTYTATKMKSSSPSFSADLLDTTNFGSAGWKEKIQGLKSVSITLSGDYDISLTDQITLRNAYFGTAAQTLVWVKHLFDGTNGFQIPCKISKFDPPSTVEGLNTVSFTLESSGAATVIGS